MTTRYLDGIGEPPSGLGTAAYRDTGTADDNVPLVSMLPELLNAITGGPGGGASFGAAQLFLEGGVYNVPAESSLVLALLHGAGGPGWYESSRVSQGGFSGTAAIALVSVSPGSALTVNVGQGAPGTVRAQRPRSGAQGGSTSFAGIVAEGGLATAGDEVPEGGFPSGMPSVTDAGSALAIYRFGCRAPYTDSSIWGLGTRNRWRACGAEPWFRIDPADKWFADTPSSKGPPGGGGPGGREGGPRNGGDGGDGFAIIMAL